MKIGAFYKSGKYTYLYSLFAISLKKIFDSNVTKLKANREIGGKC